MPTTIDHLSILANNTSTNIGNTLVDSFNTLSDTIKTTGDYVVFGSNDRRHGQMGLIIGPIYDMMWKNLTVVISSMFGMTIEDYCNFNDRMYGYMTRLMLVNLWEHNTTLSMLCTSGTNQASGNSETITHEAQIPPYTMGNNYLNSVREIKKNEKNGIDATTISVKDTKDPKNPYYITESLFPDDNGKGVGNFSEDNKWKTSDPNSILYKTKCLFEQHKINTLISRFGTNTEENPEPTQISTDGDVKTIYGLSHGRNLLKKAAENGKYDENGYLENGYNNPYCRVWTHHHQYIKFKNSMRPFENNYDGVKKSHDWGSRFKGPDDFTPYWKSNARWDKTVFEKRGDGLINITPHFNGGGDKNIHAKDCMFSIENLAWKDYDPYSFETALSWEQRGPLGGRIMWFPPYGLTFNETTRAQWNASTFIGRGEDVYTYVNTKRSGVLRFYMLVDHPSVIDYVTWYEANKSIVSETDVLRYFAGCDTNDVNDKNSLLHYVQPTPLTDESDQKKKIIARPNKIKPKDPPPAYTESIQFNVYFPNNYSGYFDINDKKIGADFVINYLLGGKNAQDRYALNADGNRITSRETLISEFNGRGYEMESDLGITDETEGNEYGMIGSEQKDFYSSRQNAPVYEPTTSKIWKFRVDGIYEVPTSETGTPNKPNNIISNTLGQNPQGNDPYVDTKSFHLNCSLENQHETYGGSVPENAYTFTEVVKAISDVFPEKSQGIANILKRKNITFDKNRIDHLKELFNGEGDKGKFKLIRLGFYGYASSQGSNKTTETNTKRNQALAEQRADSIESWIKSIKDDWKHIDKSNGEIKKDEKTGTSGKVAAIKTVTDQSNHTLKAKATKCVNCVMTFKADATVDATDADPMANEKYEGFYKINGETYGTPPKDVYRLAKDGDTSKWVETEDGVLVKIDPDGDFKDGAEEQDWLNVMSGKEGYTTDDEIKSNMRKDTLFNKVRYDQEYYFFRKMSQERPLAFEKLMDRLQYFDPAFHSMSPEGFNARLTFLNQCTRQGDTVGVSDKNRVSASNMAFGRPPFCVLRIGDFYNQMIVIDDINIEYDTQSGIVWDLNDEGVGVQPMLAQVSINFTFIGGGSLDGPIRRLQNAMSFNFYSNSELYDNRADRVTYSYERKLEMGGGNHHEMKLTSDNGKPVSLFHSVEMYDPDKFEMYDPNK